MTQEHDAARAEAESRVGAAGSHTASHASPHVTLKTIALLFVRIGLTSFGGGMMAWMHREMVETRRWFDESTFLSGWAISQVMPGATPVNLAIYYGYRMRKGPGALAALLGLLLPTFAVFTCCGALYWIFGANQAVHNVLVGMAAVGVGATFAIGMKVATTVPPTVSAVLIAITTFAAVGILHWPLVPVVLVAVPTSIFVTARFGS